MIGERIKGLREQKGYSISKLADLAGVSKSYLSYLERNMQNNPSLQVLTRIASHLDSSIEYLLGQDSQSGTRGTILDEEWGLILKNAVDDGMSKSDLQALVTLVQSAKWKEITSDSRNATNSNGKTSNIYIVHIDH